MAGFRRTAAVVGVVALSGGALVLATGVGGEYSGLTPVLYAAGGVLAAGIVPLLARDWFPSATVDTPGVESAVEFPAPGDEFDHTLSQFGDEGQGYLPDRRAIHDRLRELAIGILARRQGYTRERAAEIIDDGGWPDDTLVAAFLQDPDTRLPRSWPERARTLAADEPSDFQQLVRRTVDELATRSELVDLGTDPDASTIVTGLDRTGGDDEHGARPTSDRSDAGGGGDAMPLKGRTIGHWRVVVPAALGIVGLGFALQNAPIVLAGAVPLGLTVYARAFTAPTASLAVERSVGTLRPDRGEVVEVTITVQNVGDRTLPDLRIVDGVPSALSVTAGSPRHATALRPGESTSFSYAVTAWRGHHEFDPIYAAVRDYAGATVRVQRVESGADADATLTCVPSLGQLSVPVPMYEQTGEYLGRVPAEGGEGVEFHATREYQPGDSTSRIDWKRLAKSPTEELTTIQFREQRAATVALVVDADSSTHLARGPDKSSAIERSIEAAGGLARSLLDTGDRVGLAALGPIPFWFAPGTGIDHRKRIEEVLATEAAFSPTPPEAGQFQPHWVREFHRRFPAETQVVLLSPLCDRRFGFVVHRLRAYGHPVTIVSPDPTTDGTVGRRLVRLERRFRIQTLRESGVRVGDWPPDQDLAVALARSAERWRT